MSEEPYLFTSAEERERERSTQSKSYIRSNREGRESPNGAVQSRRERIWATKRLKCWSIACVEETFALSPILRPSVRSTWYREKQVDCLLVETYIHQLQVWQCERVSLGHLVEPNRLAFSISLCGEHVCMYVHLRISSCSEVGCEVECVCRYPETLFNSHYPSWHRLRAYLPASLEAGRMECEFLVLGKCVRHLEGLWSSTGSIFPSARKTSLETRGPCWRCLYPPSISSTF